MKIELFKGKKGIVDNLVGLVVGVGAVGITLAIVFLILAQVRTNSTVVADPNTTAAVVSTTNALQNVPSFLPIIIIALIGVIVLGAVQAFRGRS